MFILTLTYKKPIEEVEKYLEAHIQYLEKYYASNVFICSGRKNPRTGGVILANEKSRENIERIIKEDPFYIHNISDCDIIEFIATKSAKGLEALLD